MSLKLIDECMYYDSIKNVLFIDNKKNLSMNEINENILKHNFHLTKHKIKYNNYIMFRKIEILLTNKCNLNCIYCYSQNNRTNKTLDFQQIKLLIDQSVRNNLLEFKLFNRDKHIDLFFHGGGEPTCEFKLIKKIVKYVKESCEKNQIKLNLNIKTNGSFNEKILKWLIDNNFMINISLDGKKMEHNLQRSSKNNISLYEQIIKNLNYLNSVNASFEIRSTITNLNINKMEEFANYICQRWPNVRSVIFEPIMIYEKKYEFLKIRDINNYISNMEKLRLLFNKNNINFNFNVNPNILFSQGICGSLMFNVCIIDANGNISLCHERCDDEKYIYGKVTNNEIIWYDDVIEEIKNNNNFDKKCNDCIIKNFCFGGCISRRKALNSEQYCELQKYFYINAIKELYKNKKKYKVNLIQNEDYEIINW